MLTLNRSAIVAKPKQPFLDWLHAADPTSADLTLRELGEEPTVYLVPECDAEDVDKVVRESCRLIFEEQLEAWYTDSSAWPQGRDFDVFCRWFDYQHHSLLFDICDEPLIRSRD
jgi:hypothetical protein